MSFLNAVDKIDQSHAVTLGRPAIQFKRGDLVNVNELLRAGCWQLPVESFAHIVGDRMPITPVLHAQGSVTIDSYLLPKIHIAGLVYQKRWFIQGQDGNVEYLKAGEYRQGAKSRLRIFGLVKELCDLGHNEPVIVTVSGLNAKAVEDALKKFKREVISAASRIAKHSFPLYAFWLPLVPGEKQSVKNNQYVTPPKLAIPGTIDQQALDSLYVGDRILLAAAEFWQDAQSWMSQGDREPQPGNEPQDDMIEEAF